MKMEVFLGLGFFTLKTEGTKSLSAPMPWLRLNTTSTFAGTVIQSLVSIWDSNQVPPGSRPKFYLPSNPSLLVVFGNDV